MKHQDDSKTGLEIAIIGMAGKFPGANEINQFWDNLKNGVDSISTFTEDELIKEGVNLDVLQHPNFVKAKGYLEEVEYFDESFFAYTPREAKIMDPQIRMLQETTWEALEMAGYNPFDYEGLIGLYVGASTNFNWMKHTPLLNSDSVVEFSEAGTLSYKDAISTLTSYKLGLKGPSFTLYTACSTSLLSIHLACRSLLTGECSIAAAGGVSITYPKKNGYKYHEGMTSSPDGKVRTFDAEAQGAVFSDGVGMVILKRLEDAIADGDTIYGVIKGSAANNDGGRKVGYTAPSVEGQAEVIQAAHSFAEVDPSTISYVETHGTATPLGDSIEVEALKRAFQDVDKKSFCAIGSVKSNVGHLDTAAGVTGLIKTVLSMRHKQLPPTLNVKRPNSKIDFIDSPFYINTDLVNWQSEDNDLLRAGVSAFGYGGTNVHIVLEEAPKVKSSASTREKKLMVLSARSKEALNNTTVNMVQYLESNKDVELADVAYTLQTGRRSFPYRRAVLCKDIDSAINNLKTVKDFHIKTQENPDLVFVLPSEYSSIIENVKELYQKEPLFLKVFERNMTVAQMYTGQALKEAFFKGTDDSLVENLTFFVCLQSIIDVLIECDVRPSNIMGTGLAGMVSDIYIKSLKPEDVLNQLVENYTELQTEWTHGEKVELLTQVKDVDSNSVIVHIGELLNSEINNNQIILRDDLLEVLGQAWELGVEINWSKLYEEEYRLRIALPTYPFEKKRYWIDPAEQQNITNNEETSIKKRSNIAEWFYTPGWMEKEIVDVTKGSTKSWLLFLDNEHIGLALKEKLERDGHRVITVGVGPSYKKISLNEFTIYPTEQEDYYQLFNELQKQECLPEEIVHLWNVDNKDLGIKTLDTGFYSLISLAKTISKFNLLYPININVMTNNMQKVVGDESIIAEKSTLLAPIKVFPQEYPNIRCRSVDFMLSDNEEALISNLYSEIQTDIIDTVIAIRNNTRYIRIYEPIPDEKVSEMLVINENELASKIPNIRSEGVYLITGGMGGVGLKLAEYLARTVKAKLILVSRTALPDREEWDQILQSQIENEQLCQRINHIQKLESLGAKVMTAVADVADEEQMRNVIHQAEANFGHINGVIHAAGVLRVKSAQCPMEKISRIECEEQFLPKVHGVLVLDKLLGNYDLDFCYLVSSLSPILGGLGFVAYSAANLYLDSFSDKVSNTSNNRWTSINWGDWQYTGTEQVNKIFNAQSIEALEMTSEEGQKTFQCVLGLSGLNQVIISSGDLNKRFDQWINLNSRKRISELETQTKTGDKFRNQDEVEEIIIGIWKEFYSVDTVNVNENFFDLGATSLHIIQIHERLINRLEKHISIGVMFEYPSIRSLARYLSGDKQKNQVKHTRRFNRKTKEGNDIAIIGIDGRFPGAQNVNEFWNNIKSGTESIQFFTDEELIESGVNPMEVKSPNYVKAKGYLEGTDNFDAPFFDYTPQDASLMDPQLRVFHECAWSALEHAGYNIETYPGLIGVYSGASPNLYWQVLSTLSEANEPAGQFLISLLNDKDSLSTQISYKFNLKGPSMNIFTGCSTSLVAIHNACQALLQGHCDIAIAGGITLTQPEKSGYTYQEGMLFSSDGHCRPFDENANGMLFGDGVGIVVLKPLQEAINDGDTIHAVIKGTAINNDGNRKIGYTAPSVEGQVEVIKMAQHEANVEPESISYIETHGTATKLGDTIEIKALSEVFNSNEKQSVPIGSVKANVGHLNAASGVAGLIKTVYAMKDQVLPPSVNFTKPNTQIGFEKTPFYVNQQLNEWKEDNKPLRAGVSSFGIGGTNAHIILEEAPKLEATSNSRPYQMLMISAKSKDALDRMTLNLGNHLEQNPHVNLADASYTLQIGRKEFKHRRALVCSSTQEGIEQLNQPEGRRVQYANVKEEHPKINFLFSGNGSQYVNMGLELYEQEAIFREAMDECFAILQSVTNVNMKEVLYPTTFSIDEATEKLKRMEFSQPILFAFEYSVAKLLMGWGIKPEAMIGYSFGEYVAACLAEVFTLEDALKLVVKRGQLMSSLPTGVMLSVPLPEEELIHLINSFEKEYQHTISLAVVNGPACIVSGTEEAIVDFENELKKKRFMCMRVTIEGAAHSHELDSILDEYASYVSTLTLREPKIPYLSNLTGTWIRPEEATNPVYWVKHMRGTVRFSDGIQELNRDNTSLFIEIGPGNDLSRLTSRLLDYENGNERIFNTVRSVQQDVSDMYFLFSHITRMWVTGISIDWEQFYKDEKRRRIPLPMYSFNKISYKLQGNPYDLGQKLNSKQSKISKNNNISEWFYTSQWKSSTLFEPSHDVNETWIVFVDQEGLGNELVKDLLNKGQRVITVEPGLGFNKENNNHFIINPEECTDYVKLLDEVQEICGLPTRIVHMWGITDEERQASIEYVNCKQNLGFYSIFYLTQALGDKNISDSISIRIITNGVQQVIGDEELIPEKSTVLGTSLVVPQEYSYLSCSSIDVVLPVNKELKNRLINQLVEECLSNTNDKMIAYRGNKRFVQTYEPLQLEQPAKEKLPLRKNGVYLITGGLGGIGTILAKHLAQTVQANLVLLTRTGLPNRDEWDMHLTENTMYSDRIRKVLEIEETGSKVYVLAADVADQSQLYEAIHKAEQKFGKLNGVIHGAGILGGKTFNLIQELEKEDCEEQFSAKVYGLLNLEECLRNKDLDFCVLMSSISAALGGLGYVSYAASNIYMDVFAQYINRYSKLPWISVNWSDWKYWEDEEKDMQIGASVHELSMTPEEGVQAFNIALSWKQGEVLIHSPGELQARIDQWVLLNSFNDEKEEELDSTLYHSRPQLLTEYVAPRNEVEEKLSKIWRNIFKVSEVGVHDDLLELGGDSLKAITIVSKIHKEFNVEVPIKELFTLSNIEKLANYISRADKSEFDVIVPAEPKSHYQLSSAQKRFYVLHRLYPESTAYNDTSVILLNGKLNIERLEKAFTQLIKRHEIFRTTIEMKNDKPVQIIHDHADFHITQIEGFESEVEQIINEFIRPFNFNNAPYFRVGLIRLEEQKHILIIDLHHIVTDGVSYDIFVRDLFALYSGEKLPNLKIQYKDYSEWQQSEKEKEIALKHEQYWLEQFKDGVPVLNMPTDYTRPEILDLKGSKISFTIDSNVTKKIKRLLAKEETTLYTLMLSVYNILLGKYTGQEDVVIGSPITGRPHADLQDIIGVFVNMLGIRNYPRAEQRFTQFLFEVKEQVLQAFEHQKCQYEDLVNQLGLQGTYNRNPLFDVSFVMQNMDADHMFIDGLELKTYDHDFKRAQMDLLLRVVELEDTIELTMEYATSLYTRDTVQKLCERYVEIFEQIVDHPEILLKDISFKQEIQELQPVKVSVDFGDFNF